jgi:RNA polymerase sigma-70 factor (ECF subfamily)
VSKYQERLYWHIRKLVISHEDADDVLQNTFIKAWRSLSNFREESQLFTWLYKIATNESLGFLRSKTRWSFLPFSSVEKVLKQSLSEDPYFKGDQIQRKLQEAILELPEKQRLVFNMRYYDELSYEEISKILDTSVGALKASYHHAAKKIEEKMKSGI